MAMDRGFFEAIESFKAFGFKPYFDYRCDRLHKVEPWKSIASRIKTAADTATPSQTKVIAGEFYYEKESEYTSVFN